MAAAGREKPELSKAAPGPRGLSRTGILVAAIALMEDAGEAGFSLRRLGERVGCDPMAILYHFKSKDGLYRAMADALTARLGTVDNALPWDERLREHARHYRALALGHPHTFGLTQRFLNTGVSDFANIEMVHCALADAGIADDIAPSICLAWYASVIGLCMGEIGGLIRSATETEAQEIKRLPQHDFPHLKALARSYRSIDAEQVFEVANDLLVRAIAARA